MDAVFLYYVLFVDVFGHDLFIWFLGTWVLPLQNRASAEAGAPLRLVPACWDWFEDHRGDNLKSGGI